MEQSKPLSRWRFELQSIGKKHWLVFYREMLGTSASSIPRLYKALNNYGFWPMFEAIVATSDKDFEGSDPLNYVIKVAQNKWKEGEEIEEQDETYMSDIEAAKEKSRKDNEALERRLRKVK